MFRMLWDLASAPPINIFFSCFHFFQRLTVISFIIAINQFPFRHVRHNNRDSIYTQGKNYDKTFYY